MPAAVFLYLLLLKTVFCSSASKGQRIFTVEPGQNILLPCRAPDNRPVIAAEWSRADLDPEYVFLYRDEQVVPFYQHPSFRNRVDLQDRKMKDGDVSLVLKNVRTDDRGTYECRVFQTGNKIRKRANLDSDPISVIILDVAPSPPPGVSRGRWTKVSRSKAGSVGPTSEDPDVPAEPSAGKWTLMSTTSDQRSGPLSVLNQLMVLGKCFIQNKNKKR